MVIFVLSLVLIHVCIYLHTLMTISSTLLDTCHCWHHTPWRVFTGIYIFFFANTVLYILLLETQLLANQLPIDIGPYSKIGLRQYTNIDAADVLTKPDF